MNQRRHRKPIQLLLALISIIAAFAANPSMAQQQTGIAPQDRDNPLKTLISGYYFIPFDLRALQDDDFDNPGFGSGNWKGIGVAYGEELWRETEGSAGKSCSSCHDSNSNIMRAAAAAYPKHSAKAGKVINLEQQINMCRTGQMSAEPWAYGTEELKGMTSFLRLQSRGLPATIRIDGGAAQSFELGKQIYNQPIGQLGMSCAQCHNDHYGKNYRDIQLSQGHSNGYPVFRNDTQRMSSLHERFNACYNIMRATPFDLGSPEYVALELYLAWRGKGLPLEAPAIRR